jgi:hypothetical protein
MLRQGDPETPAGNLILCKDLSRLGRDYIEVGRYTDILFPAWDVRFIALLDEIDTAKDDNDMMHFRSLMNDYHLKDLSNKVKTVFRAKAAKHGLITGRAPYGYLKSPKTQYGCHRHIMTGRSVCSKHTIGENPLKKIVLAELHQYAQAIILDETLLLEKLKKQMAVDNSEQQTLLQKEVRRLQADLDESDRITESLYKDKVVGKISAETFAKLLAKNEQERKKRQAQFDDANGRLSEINGKLLSISKWAGLIRKHTALKDLTRADVEELIDRIEVGESSYSTRSERVQEIRIYWQFVGYMGG